MEKEQISKNSDSKESNSSADQKADDQRLETRSLGSLESSTDQDNDQIELKFDQQNRSTHFRPDQETNQPEFRLDQWNRSLLATAEAQLITPFSAHPVRLLIDPGSELTFVSNNIVRINALSRHQSSFLVTGMSGMNATRTRGVTTFTLRSNYSSQCVNIIAHIVNKMTNDLPSFRVTPQEWPHLTLLQLADPDFLVPRPVDILLGADSHVRIIEGLIIKHDYVSPMAQLTAFGWVVLGPVQGKATATPQSFHTAVETSDDRCQELLAKFWTQEDVPITHDQELSPDEQACEEHFRSTHTRDECGRYIVRIPLKTSRDNLGTSYVTAQRCLFRLLKRLNNDEEYNQSYCQFMKEYEDLGHMKRVPIQGRPLQETDQINDDRSNEMTLAHDASASGGLRVSGDRSSNHVQTTGPYYLPHHGVFRPDRSTTKLRVVFNGSSPTTTGVSVNDIQHVGAKLQKDIFDILLWIRQYKYLFTTDITKMYRQIKVHEDDWDLQRIMWIDEQLNMVPYQLTTVTYGTRSAPFLAVRSLLQLVEDEGHRFPLAIEPITKGRYVDDIFGGSDQLEKLVEISDHVTQLCRAGGFPLAKWHSNSTRFMKDIAQQISTDPELDPESDPESDPELTFEDSSTKILGLSWNAQKDQFKFKSNPPCSSSKITKRVILSETAQLYDPLGFLAPFIIKAKVLLQELWLEKLKWDDQVSDQASFKWISFREELDDVSEIAIPRWINITSKSTVELHGFSDASQLATAAAIYIRVENPGEQPKVTLICAKSKVAPLKRLSIPRLELTAALLVSKLMKHVQQTLELTGSRTYLWTDSSVTLTWIRSHPSRWKDFVRNRVSAIQDLTPNSVWRFVPGKENPADCASRGLSMSQLQKHHLWWTGPPWLRSTQSLWPVQPVQTKSETNQEERPGLSFFVARDQDEYHWDMIYRYSSLIKLLRVTAICFRVSQIIRKLPQSTLARPLTPQDIDQSRVFWIKATQAACFRNEIKLIGSKNLPPVHPFNKLTAFIDTQGIIRVGGRLAHSQLELETIHPAILPKCSKFTELIISDAHLKTLHGGTQATMNHIRRSYWIIGGRAPIRSHVLRCMICARQRGVRAQQLMGQLPAARVTPSRPFFTSGVDYAGPLTIKTWKGRGAKNQKGWLCIFVCFATSAVHLEAVSDCTADSFIAAFRRFTGRRGICHTLHSDCGTNFIGADAALKKMFTQGSKESNDLCCSLTNDGTTWKFNPPGAPHMGGKWEAAVKSVKYHLSRSIGETALTYEELTTLLVQIEAVLNSRPLEPLSDDPEDVSALTPAHFLIGGPITTVPESSVTDIAQSRLSRWQFVQQRLQQFWSIWSAQYLQRHLAISKWHHPSNQIKVGSLVLITDERLPPGKWPLARVIQLHPGKDQLTRVVTLRTATSTLTRPIRKLAILPVQAQDDQIKK